jgi:hypothetical protein
MKLKESQMNAELHPPYEVRQIRRLWYKPKSGKSQYDFIMIKSKKPTTSKKKKKKKKEN